MLPFPYTFVRFFNVITLFKLRFKPLQTERRLYVSIMMMGLSEGCREIWLAS